ncbi:hypothetical protein [Peterkaempfera sp. SMS 1(5)a]|uniref:hypothetical protein n=1 Tax=Peterkaempfera podocarpi TaxID=3232308 RepID=UPI003670184F
MEEDLRSEVAASEPRAAAEYRLEAAEPMMAVRGVEEPMETARLADAEGVGPARLTELRTRVQNALDRHVNTGLALPRFGDQLHVTVRMVHAEGHGERITLSDTADPPSADQRRWDLGHEDAVLMHQTLRYLGMPGDGGPPAQEQLAVIEEVCDSAAPLRSHPLPRQ